MSFAITAVAGIAISAVGAGVSAYGAAKNASAQQDAANKAASNAEGLYQRGSESLDSLIRSKEKKLKNAGDIFDRMESTGAFGDTDTLKNLRQAQSDFSALAAGDFTGFEAQLRKTMSDALVNTVGSGSPVGAYAGLAADAQLNYRKEGLSTAVGLSDFFANQTNVLLGQEFGIMDQKFNTEYQLDAARVNAINNYKQQSAATEGVGIAAAGQATTQIGGLLSSYGMFGQNQNTIQAGQASSNRYYDAATGAINNNRVGYSAPSIGANPTLAPVNTGASSYSNVPIPLPSTSFYDSGGAVNDGTLLPSNRNATAVPASNNWDQYLSSWDVGIMTGGTYGNNIRTNAYGRVL